MDADTTRAAADADPVRTPAPGTPGPPSGTASHERIDKGIDPRVGEAQRLLAGCDGAAPVVAVEALEQVAVLLAGALETPPAAGRP